MIKQSYRPSNRTVRDYLKLTLMEARRGLSIHGIAQKLTCPYCGRVIEGDPPMHEALISRGKAMNSDEVGQGYDFLMSRYNCVLPCVECHSKMVGVGGRKGFETAARHLVAMEGYFGVHSWLRVAAEKLEAGQEALNWFESMDFDETEKET